MAVAPLVLERNKVNTEERETFAKAPFSAEEMHNSRIKENYAKLINPEVSLRDIVAEPIPVQQARPVEVKPYLVENARADAAIFRADSAVNMRAPQIITPERAELEEEENEDLRPTQTTIQYRTLGENNSAKLKLNSEAKEHILGKREKIIIAVFVSVVVALLTLVIVNSVIIAGINSELASIGQGIDSARIALQSVNSQITEITSTESIIQFAQTHGINLR